MNDKKLFRQLKWRIRFVAWRRFLFPKIFRVTTRYTGYAIAINIFFKHDGKIFIAPLCCNHEFSNLGEVAEAFIRAYKRKVYEIKNHTTWKWDYGDKI